MADLTRRSSDGVPWSQTRGKPRTGTPGQLGATTSMPFESRRVGRVGLGRQDRLVGCRVIGEQATQSGEPGTKATLHGVLWVAEHQRDLLVGVTTEVGLDLTGVRLVASDTAWHWGSGETVRADSGALVALLSGRTLPDGRVLPRE